MLTTKLRRVLRRAKRRLIANLKARADPLLYPSGYGGGYRLFHFGYDDDGDPRTVPVPGSAALADGIEGFTEDGVISDAYAGGLSTAAYEDLPLEDLIRLDRILTRTLRKEGRKADAHR